MENKRIFLLVGIVFASEIIWQLFQKFCYRSKSTNSTNIVSKKVIKSKENISEVMFFSKESSFCRDHAMFKEVCPKDDCPVRYLRRLESYLNHAKQSLDVCMYVLTCEILSKPIINAHKRGVLVRVIMDGQMACNDAAQTAVLHNNGIATRLQHTDVLMHHKFVIVDDDILITGSTNWTMTAFFGNFDNLLVTNQHSLVKPFVKEFEKLWKLFESSTSSEKKDKLKRNTP